MEEVDFDDSDLQTAAESQADRLRTLRSYCEAAKTGPWHENNMFYVESLNLAVCLQPKAASTDLTKFLAQVVGLDPMDNDFQRIKKCHGQKCLTRITDKNKDQLLRNATAVMFVREPLERIVAGKCIHNFDETEPIIDLIHP